MAQRSRFTTTRVPTSDSLPGALVPFGGGGSGTPDGGDGGVDPPENLSYTPSGPLTIELGSSLGPLIPSYDGGAPTSWSVSPTLPQGVTIDGITGVIAGTPAAEQGLVVYTVTAANEGGEATAQISFSVVDTVEPPTFFTYSPTGPFSLVVGQPLPTMTATADGDPPLTYSVTPALPTGISQDAATGLVSGTPSVESANTTYTASVTNDSGVVVTTQFDIEVTAAVQPPNNLTYPDPGVWTVGTNIVPLIPSYAGGTPDAWSVTDLNDNPTTLPFGVDIDVSTGIISGTPAIELVPTAFRIVASNAGGSTFYDLTLEIGAALDPPSNLSYPSPSEFTQGLFGSIFPTVTGLVESYSVSPALPAGLEIDTLSGVISGIAVNLQGDTVYTVTAGNAAGTTPFALTLSVVVQPPGGLSYSDPAPTYRIGTAITPNTPSSTGGAIDTYSVSPALSSGLALNTGTGVISGTPDVGTEGGPTTYTLTGTNPSGQTSTTIDVTVEIEEPKGLSYTPSAVTVGEDQPMPPLVPSLTGGEQGTTYALQSGSFPAGVSIDSGTGIISGTPTAIYALTTLTIEATNSSGSTTADVDIEVVASAPFNVSYAENPWTVTDNTPASNLLTAEGTDATWSVVSGTLPAGLAVTPSTGDITGTPTAAAAEVSVTIRGVNAGGQTDITLLVTVLPEAPGGLEYNSGNPVVLPRNAAMTPLSPTLTSGTIGELTFGTTGLPPGLMVDGVSGVVSGTPTTKSSSADYTVTVQNVSGSDTDTIDITVGPEAPDGLLYNPAALVLDVGVAIAPGTYVPTVTAGEDLVFSILPALPANLTLDTSTGEIAGTPNAQQTTTAYTVTATNSSGASPFGITIEVVGSAPFTIDYTPDRYPATNPQGRFSFASQTPIPSLLASTDGTGLITWTADPALIVGGPIRPPLPSFNVADAHVLLDAAAGTDRIEVLNGTDAGVITSSRYGFGGFHAVCEALWYAGKSTAAGFEDSNGWMVIAVDGNFKSNGVWIMGGGSGSTPASSVVWTTNDVPDFQNGIPKAIDKVAFVGVNGPGIDKLPAYAIHEFANAFGTRFGVQSVFFDNLSIEADTTQVNYCVDGPQGQAFGKLYKRNVWLEPDHDAPASSFGGWRLKSGTRPQAAGSYHYENVKTFGAIEHFFYGDLLNGGWLDAGHNTGNVLGSYFYQCAAEASPYVNGSLGRTMFQFVDRPAEHVGLATQGKRQRGLILVEDCHASDGSIGNNVAAFTIVGCSEGTVWLRDCSCVEGPEQTSLARSNRAVLAWASHTFNHGTRYMRGGYHTDRVVLERFTIDLPNLVDESAISMEEVREVHIIPSSTPSTATLLNKHILRINDRTDQASARQFDKDGEEDPLFLYGNNVNSPARIGHCGDVWVYSDDIENDPWWGSNSKIRFVDDDNNRTSISSGAALQAYQRDPREAPGLRINSGDGEISGWPVDKQTLVPVTVTATNAEGSANYQATMEVLPIKPTQLEYGFNRAVVLDVGAAMTPLGPTFVDGVPEECTYTAESLPPGIQLNPNNGFVSGTPTVASAAVGHNITAVNASGQTTGTIIIQVNDGAPTSLTYDPNPATFIEGTGVQQMTPANGGGVIDSYAIEGTPQLPPGITLDGSTGVIDVDTEAGPIAQDTYTVRGTNGAGFTDVTVDIQVLSSGGGGPSNLSYTPPPPYVETVGVRVVDKTPSVDGAVASYSVAPALPTTQVPALVLPTITPRVSPVAADFTDIDYTPQEQTIPDALGRERINLWIPNGTTPTDGWPIAVFVRQASFAGLPPLTSIDATASGEQQVMFDLLNRGVMVASAGTASSGLAFGGQWFYPPGHVSGRWEDFGWVTPEKSLANITQHLKWQTTHPIDGRRIAYLASSSGGSCAAFSALGPDRAWTQNPVTDGQIQTPSSIRALVWYDPATSFPAFLDAFTVGINHYESQTQTGQDAASYGDAEQAVLRASSAHDAILQPGSLAPFTPVCLVPSEPIGSTDYSLNPDDYPSLLNALGATTHPLWFAATLMDALRNRIAPTLHTAKSLLLVGNGHEASLGSLSGLVDGTYTGDATLDTISTVAPWLEARLTEAFDDVDGLKLHPRQGVVYGTPTADQVETIHVVTASDGVDSTTADLTLTVVENPPSELDYPGDPVTLVAGTAVVPGDGLEPTVTGSVDTWSVDKALPAGLMFMTESGEVAGTPDIASNQTTYNVTATNSGGSDVFPLRITVDPEAPGSLAYAGDPYTLTQGAPINPLVPSFTGEPQYLAWTVSAGALPAGLLLDGSSGVISGTPTAVQGATAVTIKCENITGSDTVVLTFTVNAAPPSNLTYDPPGPYSFNIDEAITQLTPTVTGTVDSWSVSPALPSGVFLDPGTGIITGTPTVPVGSFVSHTVTATNTGGSTSIVLQVRVIDIAPTNLDYPDEADTEWVLSVGDTISYSPTTDGGTPTSYTIDLPAAGSVAGIIFNTSTGQFTGTVTEPSPYGPEQFTVHAVNLGGESTYTFNLTIVDPSDPPSGLDYGPDLTETATVEVTAVRPSVAGDVDTFSVEPELPHGVADSLAKDNPGAAFDYTSGVASPSIFQTANYWVPGGTPPQNGWPVLLVNKGTVAWTARQPIEGPVARTGSALAYEHAALRSGFLVVEYGITGTNTGLTGNGVWQDPGGVLYPNYDAPNLEKDAEHIIQYLRENASTLGIDPTKIVGLGTDAAGLGLAWCALGADRARGSGTSQNQQSTRLAGFVWLRPLCTWSTIRQILPGTHLPDSGGGPAATLAAVSVADQRASHPSAHAFVDNPGLNAAMPVCLITDRAFSASDFTVDGSGYPNVSDVFLDPADAWGAEFLFRQLRAEDAAFHDQSSVYALRAGTALPGGVHTRTFSDGTTINGEDGEDVAVFTEFLLRRFSESGAGPLFLHPSTGEVSGTPLARTPAADYVFTATNEAGTDTDTLNLFVSDPPPGSFNYPEDPLVLVAGVPMDPQTPSDPGVSVTFTAQNGLPAGVSIEATTGTLSGTPATTQAATPYTIRATSTDNASNFSETTVSIQVDAGSGLSITYSPDRLPASNPTAYDYDLTVGEVITPLVATVGGGAVDTWEVSPPMLGAGGGPVGDPVTRSNASNIVYLPPERLALGAPASNQTLNVFLPNGSPPTGGWPVVFATFFGGANTYSPINTLSSGTNREQQLREILEDGIAVVLYGLTGCTGGAGMIYPPNHPSGRYFSYDPADDNAPKETEWVVQWVKTEGVTQWGFNPNKVAGVSGSGGSIAQQWACCGPDRARATGSTQVTTSTRVNTLVLGATPQWVWGVKQDVELGARTACYEQEAQPGVPATRFDQVAESLQKDDSPLRYMFALAEAQAHNAAFPLCLVYDEPVSTTDFTVDGAGEPTLHDYLNVPPSTNHDSWAGYMLWDRLLNISPASAAFHATESVFAMNDAEALTGGLATHTHTFSGTWEDVGGRAIARTHLRRLLLEDGGDGLVFDTANGTVSGAPNAAQADRVFTVTGTNASGTASRDLTVGAADPPTGSLLYGMNSSYANFAGRELPWEDLSARANIWLTTNVGTAPDFSNQAPLIPVGSLGAEYPDLTQIAAGQEAAAYLTTGQDGQVPATRYALSWEGTGSCSLRGQNVSNEGSRTAQRVEYDIATNPPTQTIWQTITTSDALDPVRNIRLFRLTTESARPLLRAEWVAKMQQMNSGAGPRSYRPMHLLQMTRIGAGGQGAFVFNSDSDPKTTSASQGENRGCAPEYVSAIANALGCDLHYCMPPRYNGMDDIEYEAVVKSRLSRLLVGSAAVPGINGGLPFAGLAPGLKLRMEYGNEVWNPALPPYSWTRAQGIAKYPGDSPNTAHRKFVADEILKIWGWAQEIWTGADAARLQLYIGADTKDPAFLSGILAQVNAVAGVGAIEIYGMGSANYISPRQEDKDRWNTGATTDPPTCPNCPADYTEVIASLQAQLPNLSVQLQAHDAIIRAYVNPSGTPPVHMSYEGNISVVPGNEPWGPIALPLHRSPELFDFLVDDFLPVIRGAGVQFIVWFCGFTDQDSLGPFLGNFGVWETLDDTITLPVPDPYVHEGFPKAAAVYKGEPT